MRFGHTWALLNPLSSGITKAAGALHGRPSYG